MTARGDLSPDKRGRYDFSPGASDDVVFNISTLNTAQTINLNGDQSANSVTNSTTGAFVNELALEQKTLLALPAISQVQVGNVGDTRATVSWPR